MVVVQNIAQGKGKADPLVDLKAPALAGSWSSGGDSDEATSSSTAALPSVEGGWVWWCVVISAYGTSRTLLVANVPLVRLKTTTLWKAKG